MFRLPLFPELRPHLEAAHAEASKECDFVITRYRSAAVNLRTHFERIILRAGLTPWPKLFQNLRSTRQSELTIQGFAAHIVCAWIGNTEAVANKHYFQVPDSEFEREATARLAATSTVAASSESALQNPVQYAAVSARIEPDRYTESLVFTEKYEALPYCINEKAPRQGLEPWTLRLTVARSTN